MGTIRSVRAENQGVGKTVAEDFTADPALMAGPIGRWHSLFASRALDGRVVLSQNEWTAFASDIDAVNDSGRVKWLTDPPTGLRGHLLGFDVLVGGSAEPTIEAVRDAAWPLAAFERDLVGLINRHSLEHVGGDTPDHVLAKHLVAQLVAFGEARSRDTERVEGRPSGRTQEPPLDDTLEAEAAGVVAAAIAWAREPGAGRALLVVANPLRTARDLADAGLVLGPLCTASIGVGARTIRFVGPDATGTDLLGESFAAAFLGVALRPRIIAEIRRRLEFGGDILAAGVLPDGGELWSDIEAAAARVVANDANSGTASDGPGPATRALMEQLARRLTDGVVAEVEEWPWGDFSTRGREGQRDEFRAAVAERVAAVLAGGA